MKGAALEPTHVLLGHLRQRLVTCARALGALEDGDGRVWAVGADLAILGDVVQELIDRETFSHPRHAGGLERVTSTETEQH
jgi:hypothetical protein